MTKRACSPRALAVVALATIAACNAQPDTRAARATVVAGVASAADALANAFVPQIDPMTMSDAEIAEVLGAGAHCEFRYTRAGAPVFAAGATPASAVDAVVKLNGHLVTLQASTRPCQRPGGSSSPPSQCGSPWSRTRPPPIPRGARVQMIFDLGTQLHVGYRGYYGCARALRNTTDRGNSAQARRMQSTCGVAAAGVNEIRNYDWIEAVANVRAR